MLPGVHFKEVANSFSWPAFHAPMGSHLRQVWLHYIAEAFYTLCTVIQQFVVKFDKRNLPTHNSSTVTLFQQFIMCVCLSVCTHIHKSTAIWTACPYTVIFIVHQFDQTAMSYLTTNCWTMNCRPWLHITSLHNNEAHWQLSRCTPDITVSWATITLVLYGNHHTIMYHIPRYYEDALCTLIK